MGVNIQKVFEFILGTRKQHCQDVAEETISLQSSRPQYSFLKPTKSLITIRTVEVTFLVLSTEWGNLCRTNLTKDNLNK